MPVTHIGSRVRCPNRFVFGLVTITSPARTRNVTIVRTGDGTVMRATGDGVQSRVAGNHNEPMQGQKHCRDEFDLSASHLWMPTRGTPTKPPPSIIIPACRYRKLDFPCLLMRFSFVGKAKNRTCSAFETSSRCFLPTEYVAIGATPNRLTDEGYGHKKRIARYLPMPEVDSEMQTEECQSPLPTNPNSMCDLIEVHAARRSQCLSNPPSASQQTTSSGRNSCSGAADGRAVSIGTLPRPWCGRNL
jgi:hypothetical protein